jgi:uncharacterized protein (TIGR00730 family)
MGSKYKKICVFCGSSPGRSADYAVNAERLADEFLRRGIGLVYGGASIGVMGKIADAMTAGGGEVTGVIPESLHKAGVSHGGLTELRIVSGMHERKALMHELSDGFIAMPGGLGTFEEIFEALTWAQLGFHSKPCGFLNTGGFYDKLTAFIDHAVAERFIKPAHRGMILSDPEPGGLLDKFELYSPRKIVKWLD